MSDEKPASPSASIPCPARRSVSTTKSTAQSPTAVAMRRWVCSTATLPAIFGTTDPKQVGQSGQARPDSVLVTTPPAPMSTTVANAAKAAKRRIKAETPDLKSEGAPFTGPPSAQAIAPPPQPRREGLRLVLGGVVLEGDLR